MKKLFVSFLLSFCVLLAYAQNFTFKGNDIEGQAQLKQVFNGFG